MCLYLRVRVRVRVHDVWVVLVLLVILVLCPIVLQCSILHPLFSIHYPLFRCIHFLAFFPRVNGPLRGVSVAAPG